MTDTLDAIAREKFEEWAKTQAWHVYGSDSAQWRFAKMGYLAASITALSNQGEGAVRDREADRLQFPDEGFNRWLDEGISDAGHTVWDQVVSICDAWHGWNTRPYYDGTAEADRRDAERYRWLRMQDWNSSPLCVLRDPRRVLTKGHGLGADCPSRDRLDAAIDAATQEQT